MTAMTAATLDTLSGGRFRLGLGVSGPQVSEGWHGVRFDKPLARTREYVEIVRHGAAPARRSRYDGEHYTLPLPDGPGKALRADRAPGARPTSRSTSPRSARRTSSWPARSPTAGWPSSSPPSTPASSLGHDRAPGARPGRQGPWTGFDVVADRAGRRRRRRRRRAPTRSAATPRCTSAAWAAASRTSTTSSPSGWATARRPREVQDLLPGRATTASAAAAVPLEFIDQTVAARARSSGSPTGCARTPRPGVTTLSIAPSRRASTSVCARCATVAEALEASGLAA